MKKRLLFLGLLVICLWSQLAFAGTFAYVPNSGSGNVSVIDTATNTVVATVTVGSDPIGVAALPDGSRVYVANHNSDTVSVIDTATNTVLTTITVGPQPRGVAALPDGSRVYVANYGFNTVSVIDTVTDTVVDTVTVGTYPYGVVALPDGTKVYVSNVGDDTVSVIDTATNTVVEIISVGSQPGGVAALPDGSRVYVANRYSKTVSVIDTATNTVVATVTVGKDPFALGQFIAVRGKTLCGYLGMFGMGYYSYRAEKGESVKVTMMKNPQGTSQGNQAGLTVYTATFSFYRQDTGVLPNEIAATVPYAGIYAVKASNMFSFRDKFVGDYCINVESDRNAFRTFTRGILLR